MVLGQIEEPALGRQFLRPLALGAGILLLAYLCWRILVPFLPALCWAFALALIAEPVYTWLLRKALPRNLASIITVLVVAFAIIGPAVALAGVLAGEASDVVSRIGSEAGIRQVREAIENSPVLGPLFQWLDSRYDLPKEAMTLAGAGLAWASQKISAILTGSVWVLTQVAVTLFVLFYFLRDGAIVQKRARLLIPLPANEVDRIFERIAQTIRVALGGKMVVAGIQGALGGLMFGWLGLPAPFFWGFVMAVLSIFPVIGAFLVWLPAAATFAFQGARGRALLLVAWGVLVIHPVDNLLGPVLVGSTLRLHTLLMFFSIIGGLAAFGASGIVLGPVIVTVAASLMERAQTTLGAEAPRST